MRIVVKIGTSSLTASDGGLNREAVAKLAGEVAGLRRAGHQVIVVSSGAVAGGLVPLGLDPADRPRDPALLRAASAVGQIALVAAYQDALAHEGLVAAQVLLAPTDLWNRSRYLKSRGTIVSLLTRGAVPVLNENDPLADDELRFGDNDRLAALVAHLVEADQLVLLTDTPGLFTADPRFDAEASLIAEIVDFDQRLEAMAGGPGTPGARGGMASKLAAAKIATWSGVETVIAQATRPSVLSDAAQGHHGVGTVFRARHGRLAARKLWIAFAAASSGRIHVDDGAQAALVERNRSLLAAGVTAVDGNFDAEASVEVVDASGEVFAKGLVRWTADALRSHAGRRTAELPDQLPDEVIHRDDLVMLPR